MLYDIRCNLINLTHALGLKLYHNFPRFIQWEDQSATSYRGFSREVEELQMRYEQMLKFILDTCLSAPVEH